MASANKWLESVLNQSVAHILSLEKWPRKVKKKLMRTKIVIGEEFEQIGTSTVKKQVVGIEFIRSVKMRHRLRLAGTIRAVMQRLTLIAKKEFANIVR